MKKIVRGLIVGVAILRACLLQAQPIAIVGGTIIDGTGGPLIPQGTLMIEGDRIVAIEDSEFSIPENARVIRAQGKYIIPGIMDANVHLFYEVVLESLVRHEGDYEAVIAEASQIALKNGVTTVFDSWGPRQALVNVRDNINSGAITGSRLFLAGNIVGFDGPLSKDFDFPDAIRQAISTNFVERTNARWEQGVGADLLWLTPEQVREKVRDYLRRDIDFIKYGASGHAQGEMQLITFSPRVQNLIVEEARRADMTVQTHTSSVESLHLAIEAGVDLLQHCETTGPVLIPQASLKAMVDKQIYCAVRPFTAKRLEWLEQHLSLPKVREAFSSKDQNIRNMIEAGVPLLLSTDSGVVGQDTKTVPLYGGLHSSVDRLSELGNGHFLWLQAMNEKGMKPMHALIAATRRIAEAYKVDEDLGALEKGKIADLLILDKNPLKDPKHYRQIHTIIKSGKVIDRDALPSKPVLTQASDHQ